MVLGSLWRKSRFVTFTSHLELAPDYQRRQGQPPFHRHSNSGRILTRFWAQSRGPHRPEWARRACTHGIWSKQTDPNHACRTVQHRGQVCAAGAPHAHRGLPASTLESLPPSGHPTAVHLEIVPGDPGTHPEPMVRLPLCHRPRARCPFQPGLLQKPPSGTSSILST